MRPSPTLCEQAARAIARHLRKPLPFARVLCAGLSWGEATTIVTQGERVCATVELASVLHQSLVRRGLGNLAESIRRENLKVIRQTVPIGEPSQTCGVGPSGPGIRVIRAAELPGVEL